MSSKKIERSLVMAATKDAKRSKLTLSITPEDKKTLKNFAVDQDKTVAQVIREWIKQNCREDK